MFLWETLMAIKTKIYFFYFPNTSCCSLQHFPHFTLLLCMLSSVKGSQKAQLVC